VVIVKANVYSLAAVLIVTLVVWGWGTGEHGDFWFAALSAAVALAAFAVGALSRSWWIVPAVSAAWFCGWMVAGELAPNTYAGAIAFSAAGPTSFAALGVAAARRRCRDPA
jgi:hypothetical protein